MWNIRLDEAQGGIKISRRNINKLRYAEHHPYGRKQRGTKEPLDESERGEWKADLKLNIQKTEIMASSPITSWKIDGEIVETVRDFIFLGSKITADGGYSHEIKRRFIFGRKAMTILGSIWKSRDITLPKRSI